MYVSVVASTTFGRLFITMVQLKELYMNIMNIITDLMNIITDLTVHQFDYFSHIPLLSFLSCLTYSVSTFISRK